MLSTRSIAYGVIGAVAVALAVAFMGVLAWPLPLAALVAAVCVSPAVALLRFGGWAKAVVEHAVGMR